MYRSFALAIVATLILACEGPNQSPQPTSAPTGATQPTPTITASAKASPAATGTARPTSTAEPTSTLAATSTAILTPPPTAAAAVQAVDAALSPIGMAFDAQGNLFVSNCSWTVASIDRITPSGLLTRIAGTGDPGFAGDGGPAIDAQLYCPNQMAFGPDGALYFADHVNNRIRRIDGAGIITTVAGSGPAGLNLGSFSGDGGPATQATLQEPWGIAFDASGNLYIGDRDNFRVRRVDPSGAITTVAGTGRYYYNTDEGVATETNIAPLGVAVDPQGRLVIADPQNNRVRMVDNGIISTIAGTGNHNANGDGHQATAADVVEPGHLAFDASGALLIQTGTQIRRVNNKGVISTIIGNGLTGVPTDGMAALDAPFPELWGIAVDVVGNIYVADDATSVYRIDTSGVLHLFAGKQS